MPKAPPRRKDPEPEIETMLLAAWAEFEDASAWQPSRKNPANIWRHYDGLTLTIFRRRDNFYGWSISDEEGPRFSPGAFESREDAISALGYELGVGGEP